MKELVNKFIASLHIFIFLYGAYTTWILYDEHTIRLADLEGQFSGVQDDIIKTKKKVKAIQEFQKSTEESKIRVEEVAKNIEAAQRQLPAEINDSQILSYFNQEISSLNIKDPVTKPGSEKMSTYFISKDYIVSVNGTFLQLLIFFERIASSDRIYNVRNLKLINNQSGNRGRFQMISGEFIIEAFRYNPNFKVERGFENVETPSE
jgi:Tfp pilus assembly protein PilO